jgi:Tfp pilus assembly protein FimT
MLIVISILMIVAGYSVYNLLPTIQNNRVENALQSTLMQMRRVRQMAVSERRVHVLTFVLPRTMQIERVNLDGTRDVLSQIPLTNDVEFRAEPGIPTDPALTPDGIGIGGQAVDFNGGDEIYFRPDGSAHDVDGLLVNGVVYLCRPDALVTSRAVSLLGATGRLKSWKLMEDAGGTYSWH